MLKIEEQMNVFNELITQMTIKNNPKFNIGDGVFLKRDIIEYIMDIENTNRIPKLNFGVIIGKEIKTIDDNYSNEIIQYNEGTEQVYLKYPTWIYKVVLGNNLLQKWHDEVQVNNSSFGKFTEVDIELLSNLNDFVKEQDFNKINEIKADKLHQDGMLAIRIGDIQKRFMY